MTEHDFHYGTNFCVRCDASLEEFVDQQIPCVSSPVISFRHHRCLKFMEKLVDDFYASVGRE